MVGVTLIRGRTAIQLQAFRRGGGSAEERVGPAGRELQAVVSIQGPPGKDRQTARVLGHDGPGWSLRGIVTGAGAEPGSTEEWPHATFQGPSCGCPPNPGAPTPSSCCAGRRPVPELAA
ncbi:DUF3710 domain-containing protein [Streptomyces sp. NPDC091972]|uniref:DUF3710 domain-containing protein n=1 Tax=Streptomyces sp. NPDC091972 TaxID=3366007 RepID=UPI0037F3E309